MVLMPRVEGAQEMAQDIPLEAVVPDVDEFEPPTSPSGAQAGAGAAPRDDLAAAAEKRAAQQACSLSLHQPPRLQTLNPRDVQAAQEACSLSLGGTSPCCTRVCEHARDGAGGRRPKAPHQLTSDICKVLYMCVCVSVCLCVCLSLSLSVSVSLCLSLCCVFVWYVHVYQAARGTTRAAAAAASGPPALPGEQGAQGDEALANKTVGGTMDFSKV